MICKLAPAVILTMAVGLTLTGNLGAQETGDAIPEIDAETQERYDWFTELLTGSKFTGSFTVTGQDLDDLTAEEYHIKSVQKMDEGDMWLFVARIKYSDHDVSVPLPLEVKWAGNTPIITVTGFSFLGMGPFRSRVVIYNGKYAGTWSHGDVGGHLFGTIEKGEAEGVDVERTRREHQDAEKKSDEPDDKKDGDNRP
ncbi:MAG: hypothetical protein ACR2NP_17910 [Pirellulaceae bacterium]